MHENLKKELEEEGVYKVPIVTEITPFENFYVAEDYHKNYYENNQSAPYCNFVIDPKGNKLLLKDANNVKEEYIRYLLASKELGHILLKIIEKTFVY